MGSYSHTLSFMRCGFTSDQHDDLGRWVEGEPMLVDEHGEGWTFVNGVDGVQKRRVPPPGRR